MRWGRLDMCGLLVPGKGLLSGPCVYRRRQGHDSLADERLEQAAHGMER